MVKNEQRFYEIDVLRGIAIISMVIFHFIFDLNYFYGTNVKLYTGIWKIFQISIATMFLLLVGISLTISIDKKRSNFVKYLRRGLRVFGLGMIITIITKFIFPENYVMFGILHLIGVSIILAYFFRKLLYTNLLLSFLMIALGYYLKNINFSQNYLFFFGLKTINYQAVDYYPILPWFGVVLLGLFIGKLFYKNRKRQFKLPDFSNNLFVIPLIYLGKNSLLIYLLHQIILFGGFWIFKNLLF